ncbi:MAG: hypothetical protein M5U28_05865 [Sandaracinaceae bacterium]|nr:hypothetical protein [Sandaracinaceae bacterium]
MHVLRPLARLTHRWRWIVLGVFAALLVAGDLYGAGAGEVLAGGGFTDPNSESVRAQRALEDTFGVRQPDVVVVYSHPSATYRDPEIRGAAAGGAGAAAGRRGRGPRDLALPGGR